MVETAFHVNVNRRPCIRVVNPLAANAHPPRRTFSVIFLAISRISALARFQVESSPPSRIIPRAYRAADAIIVALMTIISLFVSCPFRRRRTTSDLSTESRHPHRQNNPAEPISEKIDARKIGRKIAIHPLSVRATCHLAIITTTRRGHVSELYKYNLSGWK